MKFNSGKIFPAGHFYSPIVDRNFVKRYESYLWRFKKDEEILGFDINRTEQKKLLELEFTKFLKDFDYPAEKIEGRITYYQKNGMFSGLDSRALFVMIHKFLPKRIVEVGGGFSSLLMMDINNRFFNGNIDIDIIEPYPGDFLEVCCLESKNKLHKMPVQDAPIEMFEQLQENDILFIDSSHVTKLGSDVNHLFFNVLPRLSKGVLVHFHDIFIPDEYPKKWIFEENRSWNEQYLLQAFLMFNSNFKVLFGSYYAATRLKEDVIYSCGQLYSGGSFWLQKVQ